MPDVDGGGDGVGVASSELGWRGIFVGSIHESGRMVLESRVLERIGLLWDDVAGRVKSRLHLNLVVRRDGERRKWK